MSMKHEETELVQRTNSEACTELVEGATREVTFTCIVKIVGQFALVTCFVFIVFELRYHAFYSRIT